MYAAIADVDLSYSKFWIFYDSITISKTVKSFPIFHSTEELGPSELRNRRVKMETVSSPSLRYLKLSSENCISWLCEGTKSTHNFCGYFNSFPLIRAECSHTWICARYHFPPSTLVSHRLLFSRGPSNQTGVLFCIRPYRSETSIKSQRFIGRTVVLPPLSSPCAV